MNSIFNKKTKEQSIKYNTISSQSHKKENLNSIEYLRLNIGEKFSMAKKIRDKKNIERYFRLPGNENYRGEGLP